MLIEKIRSDYNTALKARESLKVQVLRMLISALEYDKIRKMGELSEMDEVAVLKQEVKKRMESVEVFTRVGQIERAGIEQQEAEIIKAYLPEQIGEEEIRLKISDLRKQYPDLPKGQLIGKVVVELGKEKVDGSMVARLVNEEKRSEDKRDESI